MTIKMAERLVLLILTVEWMICFFSGVSFSALSGDNFYYIKVDIFYWIPFLSGIPQMIVANHYVGLLLDVLIMIGLLYQLRYPFKTLAARILFPLLFLFYVTLTAYLTHRNYPTGIFIVLIPFMFAKDMNRTLAFEGIRYYLLWFYLSAGLLKLFSGSVLELNHFSHFLTHQFAPYYVEQNVGWRTDLNQFIIGHPVLSYGLFLASLLLELSALIGFFTKRFDRWLMVGFFAFHICNWILMDIAFVGQAAFISILLVFLTQRTQRTQKTHGGHVDKND